MRLAPNACEDRVGRERRGFLTTVSREGQPHIVPVTFALVQKAVAIGIDEKPKATNNLRRVRNIRECPRVALLWDRYDEDWSTLWWVRADGTASVKNIGRLWEESWEALNAKYRQTRSASTRAPSSWSWSIGGAVGPSADPGAASGAWLSAIGPA
jgi:PPOX class probable F420-dependent enzyme